MKEKLHWKSFFGKEDFSVAVACVKTNDSFKLDLNMEPLLHASVWLLFWENKCAPTCI